MLISVVIPTFNRLEYLKKCLDALEPYFNPHLCLSRPFEVEVIVSDDSTNFDVKIFLRKFYPWCIYNRGPQLGAASNRNSGAGLAKGEWLVFIDDDCIPHEGILEAYYKEISKNHALEGKTISIGKRASVDQECPINESGGYLWSCNFAINKTVFNSLSGFNESYKNDAMEDCDFYKRLRNANYICSFVPSALVSHPWRPFKGKAFRKQQAINTAYYVSLYPEECYKFKSAFAVLSMIRSIYNYIKISIKLRTPKGLFKVIYLRLYLFMKTWSLIQN